jgi:adenosylhomocysteinase
MQPNVVAAPALAAEGQHKIEWVRRNMPILRGLEERFAAERPFAGKRMSAADRFERAFLP